MAGTGSLVGIYRWDDSVDWEPGYLEWIAVFDGGDSLQITYNGQYEWLPSRYPFWDKDGWIRVWP